MIRYFFKFIAAFLLLGFGCGAIASDTINSVTVVADTLRGLSHCLHYKIVGVCFWQAHPYSLPTVTLKLDHYLPDGVVSVYTHPDNNPWLYAKTAEDPIFYRAGKIVFKNFTHENMGYGHEHNNSNHDINDHFHEVDIIGNPTLTLLRGYHLLLPSAAAAYMPYYSSLLDAYTWRFPALERFYLGSRIPGLHDVGKLIIHDWGAVYPRNGYANQPDDAKAAAVDALRASTIITATGQPHVYQPLSNNCGSHCHASAVKENSKNAQYQMIYPKVENQCVVFGGSDITHLHPWESDAATKGHNRYIWILWRHYHGCVPGEGYYIGSIDF